MPNQIEQLKKEFIEDYKPHQEDKLFPVEVEENKAFEKATNDLINAVREECTEIVLEWFNINEQIPMNVRSELLSKLSFIKE